MDLSQITCVKYSGGGNNLLLPTGYFVTGKITRTPDSYTIHHNEGSWLNFYEKKFIALHEILGQETWSKIKNYIGEEKWQRIRRFIRKL